MPPWAIVITTILTLFGGYLIVGIIQSDKAIKRISKNIERLAELLKEEWNDMQDN